MKRYQRQQLNFQKKGSLCIILSQSKDCFFELNETASLIWDQLAHPKTTAQIVSTIQRHYPSVDPQTILSDVTKTLKFLQDEQLINVTEPKK